MAKTEQWNLPNITKRLSLDQKLAKYNCFRVWSTKDEPSDLPQVVALADGTLTKKLLKGLSRKRSRGCERLKCPGPIREGSEARVGPVNFERC